MNKVLLLALCLAACGGPSDGLPVSVAFEDGYAIDGDTFDAEGVRYRLAGIDAPEMVGHCRPGRRCAEGDPIAARAALQDWLDDGMVVCHPLNRDHYQRVVVRCYRQNIEINDALIAQGHAEPWPRR